MRRADERLALTGVQFQNDVAPAPVMFMPIAENRFLGGTERALVAGPVERLVDLDGINETYSDVP